MCHFKLMMEVDEACCLVQCERCRSVHVRIDSITISLNQASVMALYREVTRLKVFAEANTDEPLVLSAGCRGMDIVLSKGPLFRLFELLDRYDDECRVREMLSLFAA